MISIGRLHFFPWHWPKIDCEAVKNADKNCSRVSKIKMLCFFKTKHYKTGIFFDQVSTIQRYISEVHCAWIMYMNFSLKAKDGILVFVKHVKIFSKKMSLSVPHHVWMRLRKFVILVALEYVIWYFLVLFQQQKQQKNLKFSKLKLCK